MRLFDRASLSEALLVHKGGAAPSHIVTKRAPSPVRAVPLGDDRARIPLRLDDERHRRLRIAAAHLRQTGQAVLLASLDHYLDHVVPRLIGAHCPCLVCTEPPAARCGTDATVRVP